MAKTNILENKNGVFDLIARHESVGNNIIDAMDSIDKVLYTLQKILTNEDYTKTINLLNIQKSDLKKILNSDFDRLAINKKFK